MKPKQMLALFAAVTEIVILYSSSMQATYVLSFSVDDVTPMQEVPTNVCNMTLVSNDEARRSRKVIQCTCNSFLSEVNCNDLEITDLPPLIYFPHTVQFANFRGNMLTDIKDDTFYNGKAVVELDLSSNRIDYISVKAFNAFKMLQRLQLSHNSLWFLQSDAFDDITQLRVLDLSFNDLKSILPDTFHKLKELKELKLKANPLHQLESRCFQGLSKLEVLDLESIMITNITDHLFLFIPNLRILSLANNFLDQVPTKAVKTLKMLKVLDLSGNTFETIAAHAFEGLNYLRVLYMDQMPKLKTIQEYAFGGLTRLTELHCSYNFFLTAIHENAFSSKKGGEKVPVNQVYLRQNNLHTLSQGLLSWQDSLELDLRDNPWSCDCKAKWLLNLKSKNNFRDHIWCAEPSDLRGHVMSSLKQDDLRCGFPTNVVIMISCGVAIAAFLLIIILAILIHRRNYIFHKSYFRFKKTAVKELEFENYLF